MNLGIRSFAGITGWIVIGLSLSGCGSSNTSDLEQFVAEVRSRQPSKI